MVKFKAVLSIALVLFLSRFAQACCPHWELHHSATGLSVIQKDGNRTLYFVCDRSWKYLTLGLSVERNPGAVAAASWKPVVIIVDGVPVLETTMSGGGGEPGIFNLVQSLHWTRKVARAWTAISTGSTVEFFVKSTGAEVAKYELFGGAEILSAVTNCFSEVTPKPEE